MTDSDQAGPFGSKMGETLTEMPVVEHHAVGGHSLDEKEIGAVRERCAMSGHERFDRFEYGRKHPVAQRSHDESQSESVGVTSNRS